MRILDGRTLGLWFNIDRPRVQKTRYFGMHWTGGSDAGDVPTQAKRVHDTLAARGDSIHFVGCADGTFVQMADLDAHCVHIGSAHNDDTIGCEFVCPGSAGITPAVPRPLYQSLVHGAPVTYYGFTPAQVKAAAQLAQALLWKYDIAYLSSPVCLEDELPANFTGGVIGHFQVAADKADPGPNTMVQVHSAMVDSKIVASAVSFGLSSAVGALLRRWG